MYIHLGRDYVLNDRDIIGIFNLETTWIAAGNEKLKKMLSELWSGLSMGVKMTEAEYAKKSLKEHEGIVESMKKCDTMEAAMKMHQHIERSLEDVLTEFEK